MLSSSSSSLRLELLLSLMLLLLAVVLPSIVGGANTSPAVFPFQSHICSNLPSMYSKIMVSAQSTAEEGGTPVRGLTSADSARMEREGRRCPGSGGFCCCCCCFCWMLLLLLLELPPSFFIIFNCCCCCCCCSR